ncbi:MULTISPECIES: hypothetical protein [Actinomadura]|uniref:Uncharacterized protein n=1 Tax=Actinomadura litoris TaxID=2678616 RepID=A0A7K1KSX2_9ACTN|nr:MULTISPECIES: hypothetical protein [Actinomadura]MBT2207853.1 hypothetical protein [Actinomadura sp. NEAU-AAG7]MUN35291.1 hypothetical protein [Actinomadura litoris]
MGEQPLSCPFFLAVGLNTRPDEPEGMKRALADFYDEVHLREVVTLNEGFVSAARYELTDSGGAGDAVPYWLAVYGIDGEESARRFLARLDGPEDQRVTYTPGPPWERIAVVWRMIWRNTGSTGADDLVPGRIAMIGMDPAADASPAEVAEFDDFYTRTHLPEIVAGFGYDRGSRFQLWHEFRHPAPGCPAYNAVYEAEDARAPAPPAGVSLTPGPRAWEERQVRWRVKYKRMG